MAKGWGGGPKKFGQASRQSNDAAPPLQMERNPITGVFELAPANNLPAVIKDAAGKAIPLIPGGYGQMAKTLFAIANAYGIDPHLAAMEYVLQDLSGFTATCDVPRGIRNEPAGLVQVGAVDANSCILFMDCAATSLGVGTQVSAFIRRHQFNDPDEVLYGTCFPRAAYRAIGTPSAPLQWREVQKEFARKLHRDLERERRRGGDSELLNAIKAAINANQSLSGMRAQEFPATPEAPGPSHPTPPDPSGAPGVDPWPFDDPAVTVDPGPASFPTPRADPRPQSAEFVDPTEPPFHEKDPRRSRTIKIRGTGLGRLVGKIVGPTTERIDDLACLWKSIPKTKDGKKIAYKPPLSEVPRARFFDPGAYDAKKGRMGKWVTRYATTDKGRPITTPRPQDMLKDVINHPNDINWEQAAKCWLQNHIMDEIIGRTAQGANKEFVKNLQGAGGPRHYFGLGAGGAL